MQEEDHVTKLLNFGLTVNQAKVYLSIVQAGTTSVNRISKDTHLHRQDIYKMIPKLEKMGLITKTIDMPFMVNALPMETGLSDLLSIYKQKSQENINYLESNIKELIAQVKTNSNWNEETKLTLLTTDKAIKNREDFSFKNTKKTISLILNEDTLNTPVMQYVCERLHSLAEQHITINLIIEATEYGTLVQKTIEKIMLKDKNCFTAAKITKNVERKNYQIFDDKELCIATQQITDSGFPCILWTNDENIIRIYIRDFAKTWAEAEFVNFAEDATLQMTSM